jgi:acyl transferase domain-containing protein
MRPNSQQGSRGFRFVVSTLPGHPDVGLLRAAARAGATAVLNLEGVRDPESAIAALVRARTGPVGLRVGAAEHLALLTSGLLGSLDLLVIGAAALAGRHPTLSPLRSAGGKVLLECVSADEAGAGLEIGVDGLVAKGHESGGRVGEETTFVLVQRLRSAFALPVFVHGGVGTHTAAACVAAGCEGAVLDSQLLLARESSLPPSVRAAVERMGGDETVCLGGELGEGYRVYRHPGLRALEELHQAEEALEVEGAAGHDTREQWREAIRARISWEPGAPPLWPLGQDAAFAAPLSKAFRSVGGILRGLRDSVVEHLERARESPPLERDSPLARSHGTAYPILQGPMTRVSDTPAFAAAVADGGGLPFLALAVLRGPRVRTLLEETRDRLGARPWGVGILGFVPLELRQEQLAAIEEVRPPFALIAGGRPDQAGRLERLGIPTYLHVPAPSLIRLFLDEGVRRFVFEGRECGGHVGPRTSFVLWQLAIDTLLEAIDGGVAADELHVVFAGGIHDARSGAMVAAMAAPLASRGVRVGVLIGTAYLFTEEAVRSGAILPTFQEEAVGCRRTVLLVTGPGHATRCAESPFCQTFRETRRRLLAEGKSPDDIRMTLEELNLGRLRIASKGIARESRDTYAALDEQAQRRDGMFMIGQVAALRDRVGRIADLHEDIAGGSTAWLRQITLPPAAERNVAPATALSAQVAIVGMGCLLPDAPDVATLWSNILAKHDAIREVPRERFDVDRYYDPDRRARDRIYSRWGGFLGEVPFDPLEHGIPPAAIPSIDPFQLLTLEVVRQAMRDAGYLDRPFDRERTSVILGASGGVGDLGFRYGIRAGLPMFLDHVPDEALRRLPEWTEDSFAGVLLNVAAGRVANRLDLGGLNFTVDAACASSLAAVYLAARELESLGSDMVIVGGIDTVNSPFGYLCFSSAQALSPRGRCRTFDESADGIAIGEGLVVLVLKRLADAERDGDRVYAVIRAVAGSSDGRGKGLTAPRPEGQMRVLERAYAAAGISPASVGLIEAHGTGTVAGDGAEVAALSRVFGAAGTPGEACALGSIKSMIGHTKSAAGVSGLLKVSLALHHKILPPTLNVTRPNPKLREAGTPFYVNTAARPWIASADGQPRRAGVSSFGFGGTNFHVIVEEHDGQAPGTVPERAATEVWPAELVVWRARAAPDLVLALDRAQPILGRLDAALRHVAATAWRSAGSASPGDLRLAIVATSPADLQEKIAVAREALSTGRTTLSDPSGIHLGVAPPPAPKIAFLFPGQGSQYPGMHRDLSILFPEVRHALEAADRATAGRLARPLSSYVLPTPAFTNEEEERRSRELTDTAVAQPALGAVESGLAHLLERLGVRPDFAAGHSYGEYVALSVAGVFPPETLYALSAARGQLMKEASADGGGTMAAVGAPVEAVEEALRGQGQVWIANVNAPRQTVIAGTPEAIDRATALLEAAGMTVRRIPVSCAFHSPLVEPAQRELAELLARTAMRAPRIPVFSNSLAAPYPERSEAIVQVLADHIVRPVLFVEQVRALYDSGARAFVEVGPRSVLANLVRETLSGRDVLVTAVDAPDRPGVGPLLSALAQLWVAGVAVDLEALWHGRAVSASRLHDLARLAPAAPAPHVFMVSGGRARRRDEPLSAAGVTAAPGPPAPAPVPHAALTAGPGEPGVAALDHAVRPSPSNGGSMHSQILSVSDRTATDHEAVMRQFQQLMSQFLQTQALVMTTYLQGASTASASAALLATAPAPPPPPLEAPTMPSAIVLPAGAASLAAAGGKANGGNGHIRAVSLAPPPLAPSQQAPPPPEPAGPSPAAGAAGEAPMQPLSAAEVLQRLVQIVSERTGYPEHMLSVDANIEADLGVDSIKRMEILAAFQQAHVGPHRGAFQEALEKLTALKTLRESAAALAELLRTRHDPAVA